MNKLMLPVLALFLYGSVALAQLQAPGEGTTPAVGTTAPQFGLDELRGQTKVLLAFFPAAFTPG